MNDSIERSPTLNPNSYGVVSTANSTTAALAGAATFTGTGEQNYFPEILVMCKSDVAGTLYFDFSNDGSNWDSTYPTAGFACSAGIPEVQTAVKAGRYFRVRYVNGAGAQTYLRLTTYYGSYGQLSAALNQSIARDASATVVRPTNTQDEISVGLRSGVSQFNKFGYRNGLTAAGGNQFIIADGTTNTPTILTSASTFTIAYDGTAGGSTDGAGTTGALNLYIYYLDSNGEAAIGVHTLETDGSDVTSFSGLGINRAVVGSSGSANHNVSDITITATTGGTVQAFIPAAQSTTQQAIYHVPTNARGVSKFLFLNAIKTSGGSKPEVLFLGWVYNRTAATTYEIFRYNMDIAVENHITIEDPCNFPLSAGDVLWFTADTDTNSTNVSCRFSINIYNNA